MGKLSSVKFIKRRHMDQVLDIDYLSHRILAEKTGDRSLIKRRWLLRQYEKFLSRKGTRGYILEEGKEHVVGFLLVDFSSDEEFQITRLIVEPNYRKAGFGSELLQTAILVNGKKGGCPLLVVTTYEEDIESQKFYARKGFPSLLARDHFGAGKDGVRFARRQAELNEELLHVDQEGS